MLSIQETTQKAEVKQQLELIEKSMDAYAEFHPDRASILNVESPALRAELMEMLQKIPLSEFLAKSGTTGIAGAAYMVPDKIHQDLIYASQQTDIVPHIGGVINGWKGGDLKVDIVSDETYKAQEYTSGGAKPTQTVETVQATITPKTFGVPILITEDLIEDNAFDLVTYHINKAAEAMGNLASNLALTVLKTAADGWGTVNSGASGDADETKFSGATTTCTPARPTSRSPACSPT